MTEPTESEPKKLTRAEYTAHLQEAYHVALQVVALDLDGMLAAIATAEAVGPIVDPTLWITKNRAMRCDRGIIAALIIAKANILSAKER